MKVKIMLKKALVMFTTLSLCLSGIISPIHAESKEEKVLSTETYVIQKSESEIKAELNELVKKDYPEYAMLLNSRASVSSSSKVGSPETRYADLGNAGGQPSGGVVFNTGGYIYWQNGGYNVTVSLGMSWGAASVSVSAGSVSSSVTGYGAYCPAGQRSKLKIGKDLTIQRYDYWLTDTSTGNSQYLGRYNVVTNEVVHLIVYAC